MHRIASSPSRLRSAGLILGAACVVGILGCQKPLFPKDAPRTQFEVSDRLRNRYIPLEKPDVFGNPQPALRERLSAHR